MAVLGAVLLGAASIALMPHAGPGDMGRWNRLRLSLQPLHKPIAKPGPMDWLASHPESGQTFEEYVFDDPVVPVTNRNVIYIQPLGEFSKEQKEIVSLTAAWLAKYFCLPVAVKESLDLSIVPAKARRIFEGTGKEQILSTYVLDDILAPRLPDDAAAYIAFTASDLWPGMGWNFVFGQASTRDRVGVWSVHRNGNPAKDADSFKLCLSRTLKTAAHETGHMFSILHCTKYQCCMCGSNHRGESDRQPMWLCPECVAKVCWATGADPVERYRGLMEFCAKNGLEEERGFYERSIAVLSASNIPPRRAGGK